MKNILYIFLFFALAASCFGQQSKDTLFLNKEWKQVTRDNNPVFYRVYEKKDGNYLITDRFISGKIQMVALSSTLNPLNKNGHAVFYNEDGYKTKVCDYKDNKPLGHCVWYYDNEKDSSVADYQADGKKTYTYHRKSSDKDTFTVVEQMPEFPGGVKEMMKFIQSNIHYPLVMKDKLIGGKVFIKFVVNSAGEIENAEVIKGTGFKEFDDEALRVVKLMPQWTPGKQNGENVNVFFNIPIVFGLDEPYFIFNTNKQNAKLVTARDKITNKKLSDAFDIYKMHIESNPNDFDALYNMGVISFTLKNKEDACERFRNIAEKSTEEKSTIVKNSKKYIDKYCN